MHGGETAYDSMAIERTRILYSYIVVIEGSISGIASAYMHVRAWAQNYTL